ncbi:hypothetical protein KO465_05255 [Candidatus Micrarchaeota archaeon]|nr:hypothetical protein [Candidatus Micrarchaeota archaeon]
MKNKNGWRNVFFAKNREVALKHLNKLKKQDKKYKGTSVGLAKTQIKNKKRLKTWTITKPKKTIEDDILIERRKVFGELAKY